MVTESEEKPSLWTRAVQIALRSIMAVLMLAVIITGMLNASYEPVHLLAIFSLMILMLIWYRNDRPGLIWIAFWAFAAGMVWSLTSLPTVNAVGEGFYTISAALFLCLVLLALVRLVLRVFRSNLSGILDYDLPDMSPGIPMVVVGLLLSLVAALTSGPGSVPWSLVGSGIGASIWNAHVLGSALQRTGLHLADASIVSTTGASLVAIGDSPILDLLKLLAPFATNGVAIVNAMAVLSVWAFVVAATLFLQTWVRNQYAGAIATLLFLLLPLGFSIRVGSPLDLVLPLFVLAAMLRNRAQERLLIGMALLCGASNLASGYELAVMVGLVWAFGYVRDNRLALRIGIAAFASSLAFSYAVHAMAPGLSLREAWWSSDQLARTIAAEQIHVSIVGAVVAALATILGAYQMIRKGEIRGLYFAGALLLAAIILALPARLGGVGLLGPTRLLDWLTPLGWPTGRFLELALFALTIPMGFATRVLLGALWHRSGRVQVVGAVGWIMVAALIVALLPRSLSGVVPLIPQSPAALFPIAEAGSRASIYESNSLLENKATILQPIPYLEDDAPLAAGVQPDSPSTVAQLTKNRAAWVVLLRRFYADPKSLTVTPRLDDPRHDVEPELADNPNFRVQRVTADLKVYQFSKNEERAGTTSRGGRLPITKNMANARVHSAHANRSNVIPAAGAK